MERPRGFSADRWSDLRGLFQIADGTSRNIEPTRLDRRSAVEPVRRQMSDAPTQSCWPPAAFQARIEKGQSAGDRDDVSRETMPPNPVPFFTRARSDKQIPPYKNANNAECATESPAEPAGFILRMFRLHDRRPRGVIFPLRLVRSEAETARGDRQILRLQVRASLRFQRSAPIPKTQIPCRTPSRNGYPPPRNRLSPGKTGY